MCAPLVLLVDVPDPWLRAFCAWALGSGFEAVAGSLDVLPAVDPHRLALAVVACDGEGNGALEAFRIVRKQAAGRPIVVLARGLSTDVVVRLVRSGAVDVIGMPAPPEDVVARTVLHALATDTEREHEIIGQSRVIQAVRHAITAVAPTRSTVLVTGETGVGKGLVARAIHRLSGRANRPFVHVDCSALAPSVIESELFGHEKGAFTGALERHPGRFEMAGDGTIFLDEIGDLDLRLQRKLLRVLQDREFERIGGKRTLRMAARVVAATHRDLPTLLRNGAFRADLYFRLNVFQLRIPPLRERLEDVPMLARALFVSVAERLGVVPVPLDDAIYRKLARHPWPGNVRELLNVLERLALRHQVGSLDADDLDELFDGEATSDPDGSDDSVATLDRLSVERMLRTTGGNVARAARRLGIPRSTLRYRLRLQGLDDLIPRD